MNSLQPATACVIASIVRKWLVALAMTACAATCQAAPIVPGQPGAWLVFLCRASDAPAEPQAPNFYNELFDPANADLVHAYFKDVSFGKIDLSKTLVLGWFKMNVTTAQIAPSVRNNNTQPNRAQTAEDCKSAGVASLLGSNQTIDPNAWAGFIAVINVDVDAGQADRSVIANALEPASFYEHEMLHVMGQLNHTHNLPNNVTSDHVWGSIKYDEYNDPWDIMSYDIGLFSFGTIKHGESGPLLNTAYRSRLGWLPPGRTVTKLVRQDSDRTPIRVALAPVSEPQWPGPLLAIVDLPGGVRYAVEYRKKSGFDRGVARNEVVVREWRVDQATYLVRQTDGHIGYFPGEPAFTDIGNHLKVTIELIAANGSAATILIHPGQAPPHDRPVACRVFDDGNTRASVLSEAVYFRGPSQSCIPDGSATGLCRKWFGSCISTVDGQTATFRVFDDGNSHASPPSAAVYNRAPMKDCIADGTPSGNCHKWFGLPATANGHAVQCYLFDDGMANWVGPTEAMFYASSGQVCMPDGTGTGTCRKWFGNCQVTDRPAVQPPPPPSPERIQCLDACSGARDACMAEVTRAGGPTPQQCVQEYGTCKQDCPTP